MLTLYQSHDLRDLAKQFINSTNEKRDPFCHELVITQTKGMERWLLLQYAKNEGIVAGFDFQTPVQFLMKLHFLLTGEQERRNVFERDVMPWALFEIIEKEKHDARIAMLGGYLTGQHSKLFGLCKKIAALFDQYMIYRPELLELWFKGEYQFQGSRYASYEQWQSFLWCELHRYRDMHFAPEQQGLHLVELFNSLNRTIKDMTTEEIAKILPRLSLFGMSLLPPRYMETFHLLSEKIPVSLFLLNPSREYWFDIYSDRAVSKISEKLEAKKQSPELFHLQSGNRLLANLGRTGADFFQIIFQCEPDVVSEYRPLEREESSLLEMVQGDILHCRDEFPKRTITANDNSIRVVCCHSKIREVETLLDELLRSFRDDPQLLPSDILVVSPQMDEYAPFIEQVFSASYESCGVHVPFSIADLSFRHNNRAAEFVLSLLETVRGRFEATVVLALFDEYLTTLSRSLHEEERGYLKKWIRESGIRWGVDGAHRASEGLPTYDECSWKSGVERLLLGYAMGDTIFEDTPAYGEIEGGVTVLLGEFLLFFSQLEALYEERKKLQTVLQWKEHLVHILETLWLEHNSDAISELYKQLSRLDEPVQTGGFGESIDFSFFTTLVVDLFESGESGGNFLNGAVTCASMIPMRSIPFRIVALLGMSIDSFPRRNDRSEFDLMRVPGFGRRGDRNQRNSDLYLFLEIITSVEQRLLITYSGRDEKSNSALPPSLTVELLIEYIEKQFEKEDPQWKLLIEQSLHPFSFSLVKSNEMSTFNVSWFVKGCEPQLTNPLEWHLKGGEIPQTIDGNSLSLFFQSPLDYFFKKCCNLEPLRLEQELDDSETFTLNALERYCYNRDMIEATLQGEDLSQVQNRLKAAGELPPEQLGVYTEIIQEEQLHSFLALLHGVTGAVSVEEMHVHTYIEGREFLFASKLYRGDDGRVVLIVPGNVKGKYRMDHWITHLFLNIETDRTTTLVTKDKTFTLKPIETKRAVQLIGQLFSFYCSGTLYQALPFFPDASFEYYERTTSNKGRTEPLSAAWKKVLPSSFSSVQATEFSELFPEGASSFADLGIEEMFKELAIKIIDPIYEALEGE